MAVRISVYGTANMKQIEAARYELDRLEATAARNATGFNGAMTRMSTSATRMGNRMKSIGSSMTRNLTMPIAAVGVAIFKAGQAAADDAEQQALLATAMRNNAGATDEAIAKTEEWITAQGKALGVSDDQLRPALSTLVGATKDVGKAQTLAGLAMDIAAAKHIDVSVAAKAVAKAYTGNTGALAKLVPGIDAAALKSKDLGAIWQSVNGIVGGSAAAAADTLAGKMQISKVAFKEASEEIGYAFAPIMSDLATILKDTIVPILQNVAAWFKSLDNNAKRNVVTIALVVAAAGPLISILGTLFTGLGAAANGMLWMGKQAVAAAGGLMNLWTGLTNAAAGSSAFATPMMKFGGYLRTAATATWGFVTATWASISAGLKSAGTWIADTAAKVSNTIATYAKSAADGVATAAAWLFNAATWANIGAQLRQAAVWAMGTAAMIGQTIAMNAVKLGTMAWTAAQWLLNVALDANPIGLVVIAIAALIAAVVLIATHIKELGSFFSDAWNNIANAVKNGIDAIGSWLGNFANTMKNLAINIVNGFLDGLANFGKMAWDAITAPIRAAVDGVKNLLGIHSPSRVTHTIGTQFGQGFVNGVKSKENDAINAATGMGTKTAEALNKGLVNVSRSDAANALAAFVTDTTTNATTNLLAMGQDAGIDPQVLTDAVLGDDAAMTKVQKLANAYTTKLKRLYGSCVAPAAAAFGQHIQDVANQMRDKGANADLLAAAVGPIEQSGKKAESKATKAAKALAAKLKEGARLAKEAMNAWSMDEIAGKVTTSFETMLAALQSQVQATADFMNNLNTLKSKGLNANVINSLLGMGAAQGGGFAAALAGATSEQITQYNTTYAEKGRLTSILGNTQAGATKIAPVTIAPGAIQVSIAGNADGAAVSSAMGSALDDLIKELRSR